MSFFAAVGRNVLGCFAGCVCSSAAVMFSAAFSIVLWVEGAILLQKSKNLENF